MADRTRFEIKFNGKGRDKRVSEWIDSLIDDGRDAGELIKTILDEVITGRSSITGRPMQYQGEANGILPDDPADEVARALSNFED